MAQERDASDGALGCLLVLLGAVIGLPLLLVWLIVQVVVGLVTAVADAVVYVVAGLGAVIEGGMRMEGVAGHIVGVSVILGLLGVLAYLITCLQKLGAGVQEPPQGVTPEQLETPPPWRLTLTPGLETFTPQPLATGERVAVTLEGVYTYHRSASHPQRDAGKRADALYDAGDSPNYLRRYGGLRVDGQSCPTDLLHEDRARHAYTWVYVGCGRRLSLLLRPPAYKDPTQGTLTVTIAPLTAEEATTCVEADQQAASREARQRELAERERLEALQARARQLSYCAHLEQDFLEEDFQDLYAKAYQDQILHSLKPTWFAEYLEIVEDAALRPLLAQQHPQVLAWLEARLDTIRRAQRHAITPPPLPPARPRRKFTAEEVRALKVRREQVQADDKIALTKTKLDAILKARQFLDEYDLDEDERQQLEQALIEEILHDAEEGTNHERDSTRY